MYGFGQLVGGENEEDGCMRLPRAKDATQRLRQALRSHPPSAPRRFAFAAGSDLACGVARLCAQAAGAIRGRRAQESLSEDYLSGYRDNAGQEVGSPSVFSLCTVAC
jgi:hypothetical protein